MATGSHHAEITKQCRAAHHNQRIRPSEYTRVAAGMITPAVAMIPPSMPSKTPPIESPRGITNQRDNQNAPTRGGLRNGDGV